jgi:hypothetical protein
MPEDYLLRLIEQVALMLAELSRSKAWRQASAH